MASTEAFEKAYAGLNEAQKKAVDTIYGPVMVIAGPGTGKTQILAVRIATILQQAPGSKPEEILALTFTESAVASLRKRLTTLMGASAYRVRIHTFHGFARSILETRPDLFPRIAEGSQLTEVEAITLMEELLDAGNYQIIRSPKHPYRLAKSLVGFMGELKKEHYTPESYKAELTEKYMTVCNDPERFNTKGKYAGKETSASASRRERIEKHLEVANLFKAYQEALEERSLYDYEDLIAEAVRGLSSDDTFRYEVGERSQFVLADEHQDANLAQNHLLELITDFDSAPNLFIVGDEKQAIYRFQGASLASFFYFKEKYPDAQIITLTQNYRSTSEILAAAHDLISPAPIPDPALRKELEAVAGAGTRLRMLTAGTPREEYAGIVSYIQRLIEHGASYADIAIITRKNADVLALAHELTKHGIPEDHASAELDALAHPAMRLFIALIRACSDLGNDSALARTLFLPGVPLTLTERMRMLALPREGKSLYAFLEQQEHAALTSWLALLTSCAEQMHATPAIPWLTRLARESGFLKGILSLSESEEAYASYEAFMEEVALLSRKNSSLTAPDVLAHIQRIETHELSIKRARQTRDGVHVMTAHRAKGMEFPYVVIAHVTDSVWMRGRAPELSLMLESGEDEHDTRRLLYVALTRGKREVLMTHATESEEGRTQVPLRFIADIPEHVDEFPVPVTTPQPANYTSQSVLDPGFLTARLLSQGFSPTGFNNFVTSPWQYFFRTLLRIPDAPNLSMRYGTAIHAGLKSYADALRKGEASLDKAASTFEEELRRMPMTPMERESLLTKGREDLAVYLEEHHAEFAHYQEAEFPLSATLSVPGVGEIPLSGKLDRLDVLPDGRVVVIDYKTGAPKSENDIKGLTAKGDASYYRQLVFYKLLLQKDGRYAMDGGSLHFVEPDEKGSTIVRDFTISDAEVRALETELIAAAKSIADGSAFNVPCDSSTCDYCDLAHELLVTPVLEQQLR